MKILCLNGINLNMFGKRDPAQYGTVTLAEIDAQVKKLGQELGPAWNAFKPTLKAPWLKKFTKLIPMGSTPS